MIDLFNPDYAKNLVQWVHNQGERISVNTALFNIYEKRIGKLLEKKMIDDLGEKSFLQAKERKAPINIARRVLDKLSKIYQQEPRRQVIGGKESDSRLVEKFEQLLNIDHKLNINNELLNLYLNSLLQIGIDEGKPFVRNISNHKFLIKNESQVNPSSPDVYILFMDSIVDSMGVELEIYWIYTDYNFAIYDGNGAIRYDLMSELGQDGLNYYGVAPFMYQNMSDNLCMPTIQDDTLDITLLIPLLLSDVNYIAKFTAYSIMYGVDVDASKLSMSPNVFWNFKSDSESDKKPEIGTVKPEGDIDSLISSTMSQLSMWLNTKGLKGSTIGSVDASNVASGIAKIIDEADVTDIRQYQASLYSVYETRFWDILLNNIYPLWKEQGLIDDYGTFTVGAKVVVSFQEPTPVINRGEQVRVLKDELDAGFTTKRRAIMLLNPEMTDKEVDQLIAEIEADKDAMTEKYLIASEGDKDEEQDGN